MLHFLSAQWSQTRVMCKQDTNTWRLWMWSQRPGTCWVLSVVVECWGSLFSAWHLTAWVTCDDSDSSVIMRCLVCLSRTLGTLQMMARWLCSALFMRLTLDNLLTSWSGSDLSDIRESELNFLGLLIPGPLPTHIMGKINWNKSSLDYNRSSDKWATQ